MKCPNCKADNTIITHTMYQGTIVKRLRMYVLCKFQFETTEQYSGTIEGQAFQASLFRDMVSEESRQKAREAIERRNGKCSPSM